MKWVFRYLKGTSKNVLSYGGANIGDQASILGFSNADYAADLDRKRSTSGYVFML